MTIDSSIVSRLRQTEFADPINQFVKQSQVRNVYRQDQTKEADFNNQNAFREYMKDPKNLSDPNLPNVLATKFGKPGQEVAKNFLSLREQESKNATTQAELFAKEMTNAKSLLPGIKTGQDYLNWELGNLDNPVIGAYLKQRGVTPEAVVQKVTEGLSSPGGLNELLKNSALAMDQLLATEVINQDMGNQKALFTVPKYGSGPAQEVPGSRVNVKKSPNAPVTNIINNSSGKVSEAFLDVLVKDYEAVRNVGDIVARFQKAKDLIPAAKDFMGPGGKPYLTAISFLNDRLGLDINTKGATSAQELDSILFNAVMGLVRTVDNQPSQVLIDQVREASGSLKNSPDALPQILDLITDSAIKKAEDYNRRYDDVEKKGVTIVGGSKIDIPERPKQSAATTKLLKTKAPTGVSKEAADYWDYLSPKGKILAEQAAKKGKK